MSMGAQHRVLIADDEESLRFVLRQLLEHDGCVVDEAEDGQRAIDLARADPYDLYVFDIKMPKASGLDALRVVRKTQPDALVVMMTAFGSQKLSVEAIRAGAYDYFTKPFEVEELRVVLSRALEKRAMLRRVHSLEERLGSGELEHRIVGSSEAMAGVFGLIERVANHDVTVLITGESGVGKELVAEAIHNRSSGRVEPVYQSQLRSDSRAICLKASCSVTLGERSRAPLRTSPGKFELANGGSILLDEIGEMPSGASVQAPASDLQEKEVERIGETKIAFGINARIMAATNRDLLAKWFREKTFREDLYFQPERSSRSAIPPLRERIDDLPALIEHFIEPSIVGPENASDTRRLRPKPFSRLERSHDWPGNVRELENVLHRAIIMTSGSLVDVDALR